MNYIVRNQEASCYDPTVIARQFLNGFTSSLIPLLCPCDYKFYSVRSELAALPVKYFYTLDLLGFVDNTETQHVTTIYSSLANSWSKKFPTSANLQLSNKFEQRIGVLGALITRVYYLISVDGQQPLSYLYQAPSIDLIENEFKLFMSDMRPYPEKSSIPKTQLQSVYVGVYPLSPENRVLLESNIKLGIDRLNLMTNNYLGKTINVLYYELYNTPRKSNVSRVYYSVVIFYFSFTSIFLFLYSNMIFTVLLGRTIGFSVWVGRFVHHWCASGAELVPLWLHDSLALCRLDINLRKCDQQTKRLEWSHTTRLVLEEFYGLELDSNRCQTRRVGSLYIYF